MYSENWKLYSCHTVQLFCTMDVHVSSFANILRLFCNELVINVNYFLVKFLRLCQSLKENNVEHILSKSFFLLNDTIVHEQLGLFTNPSLACSVKKTNGSVVFVLLWSGLWTSFLQHEITHFICVWSIWLSKDCQSCALFFIKNWIACIFSLAERDETTNWFPLNVKNSIWNS